MRSINIIVFMCLLLLGPALPGLAQEGKTVTITAEGLADPNAEAYKRDKGLMLDDLRNDAKRQILEKAVGSYMETSTLMQNYTLVSDKVLSRSKGFIKQVLKESQPFTGDDGFVHLLMTAEVYTGDVRDALSEMGKLERVSLLKDMGNPRISVAIDIRDAERGPDTKPERSEVAENILKDRLKSFGYRVWSEEQSSTVRTEQTRSSQVPGQAETTVTTTPVKAADFSVVGEAKFATSTTKLQASGLEVKKYVLTSWSVKCVDNDTGEEIYYNNKIPQEQSWPDQDQAIAEVGQIVASEFSKDFFDQHLQAPAKYYQLQVLGLPSYDAGQLLKKEFIGLRPVLDVNFRDFDRSGVSLFEVEFAGQRGNFSQFLEAAVLGPLNTKLGEKAFTLDSAHGGTVRIICRSRFQPDEFMARLQNLPPAGLMAAPPERIKEVVKSEETAKKLSREGAIKPEKGLDALKNF